MNVLWYFAYGRNVHIDEFTGRIKGNPLMVCRGILPGYKLAFSKTSGPKPDTGYATIEPCAKEWVEGVLYLITEEQLSELDKYEGYPNEYTRLKVKVWNIDLKMWVNAETYVAVEANPNLKPPKEYVEIILEGARIIGLSSEWIRRLEEALKHAV